MSAPTFDRSQVAGLSQRLKGEEAPEYVGWPKIRVAGKDGEFHALWPGELAGPFKRSGYELREYAPIAAAEDGEGK